jgi:hypothetical protein
MAQRNSVTAPADRTIVTTRVFDAPRELVFKAWTDPKQFARWFPPDHFSAPVCELDVRPGGVIRFHMKYGMSRILEAHAAALKGYDLSTGTVRFPADKPLPAALVSKRVEGRVAEITQGR